MRSIWYDAVKYYYDTGHPLYTNESIKGFVATDMITAEEYEMITGIPYVPAEQGV